MRLLFSLVILFSAGVAAVYGLMPFHDDWCYATAPNPDFSWEQLLPDEAFWRPFDVLWGAIMAYVPGCFPLANRIAIVLAHTMSSFFVWKALREISDDKFSCVIGTVFFAASSSIGATIFNSDAINQSWCFLFGVMALYAALLPDMKSVKRCVLVIGSVIISMLFKESGVSWLLAIPAVMFWRERNTKKLVLRLVVGCFLLAIYFSLRFALMGKIAVGGNQYYALGFDMESVIVNYAMVIFLPLMGFDVLSFVCEYWVSFVISIVASLGFWGVWVESAQHHGWKAKSVLVGVLAIAFASPHCFFKGHHPAEMHFYPVLFAGAVLLALFSCAPKKMKLRCLSVGAMVLLFASGWYIKVSEVRKHSDRTRILFQELSQRKLDYSKPIYFIAEGDPTVKYYSVFTESAGHGVYWGKACRAFNGWRDFDYHMAVTPMEVASIPYGAQTVRIK